MRKESGKPRAASVPAAAEVLGVPGATVPFSLYLDLLAKYDALVNAVIGLKRDNFNPEPAPPSQDEIPGFPSKIVEAIAARAIDAESTRRLEAFARRKLNLNEDHDEIATAILNGENLEDG